jgi:MFS family permease
MKPVRWLRSALALNRNVAVLSGTVFFFAGAWFSWYPILPLHLRDLGATDSQVGLAFTVMQLGFQAMQLVGGLLADRFGRKRCIVWPTFVYLPLYLLAAMVHRWDSLVVLLVIIDSLGAVQWPALVAMIAESVPETGRGAAFAAFEFAAGLGVALGPAVGAAVLAVGDIRLLIGGTGLIGLGCAVARWLWLEDTSRSSSSPGLGNWRALLRGRMRWFLAVASLFYLLLSVTVHGPFISLHAKDVGRLSEQSINTLMAVAGVVATIASLAGGRLIRWLGAQRTLWLGTLTHAWALLLWAYAPAALTGQGFLSISWVGMQVSFIAYQTALAKQAGDESRGSVVGLVGTITGLVAAVGPMLGAWLREAFGSTGPFWMAVLLSLPLVVLLRRADTSSSTSMGLKTE